MFFYPTVLWFIYYEKGVHLLNIVNPIQAPFAGHNPEPLDEIWVYYYDLDWLYHTHLPISALFKPMCFVLIMLYVFVGVNKSV